MDALARLEVLGAKIALEPIQFGREGKVAIYVLGGIERGLWQRS